MIIKGWGEKKAAVHFEMIVSFVLFFMFVIFLMVYIKPYGNNSLPDSVVSALHSSFQEEVHVDFTKIFLRIDSGVVGCVSVQIPLGEYSFSNAGSLLIPIGSLGPVNSYLGADRLLNIDSSARYFDVLISPAFSNNGVLTSCTELLASEFELGSREEKQIISEAEVLAMKNVYDTDYSGLRQELGLPEAFDFAILSDFAPMDKPVLGGGEVVARDYIEEVLFSDGTIENKKFTLKVW